MTRSRGMVALATSALIWAACGGGGGGNNDLDGGVDAPPDGPVAECNPLEQSGCADGERCTWVNQASGDGRSMCVADGTVNLGEPCLASRNGAPDDCKAGSYCVAGRCVAICALEAEEDTCGFGLRCGPYGGVFLDHEGTGLCRPTCDPMLQNCPSGESCYLLDWEGTGACSPVPPESLTRVQDTTCYGPEPDTCYLHGCARGFDTFGLGTTCMQLCTPTSVGVGQLEYIQGNPNGVVCGQHDASAALDGAECRFLNSLLLNDGLDTPDTLGLCITESYRRDNGMGSCRTHQLDAAPTAENVRNGTYVLGCESINDLF